MARFTNIRALAFDLDGTLVDSVPGLANALDQALNTLQLPAAGAPRVATWIGNGVDVMIERALSWAQQPGAELLREARSLFDKYYVDTAEAGTTLFPHVAQTLEKLTAAGMPLALVTNKPTPFVAPLLRSLGIAQHFSLVIGGDDVAVKKPHPAPLFLVLGKFGLLPQELLFVGDSRNDILAAKAAGCPCVGMSFGYNYGEPVSTSEPDLVLDNFNDLMSALGR